MKEKDLTVEDLQKIFASYPPQAVVHFCINGVTYAPVTKVEHEFEEGYPGLIVLTTDENHEVNKLIGYCVFGLSFEDFEKLQTGHQMLDQDFQKDDLMIKFRRDTHRHGQYRWTMENEPNLSLDALLILEMLEPKTAISFDDLVNNLREYEEENKTQPEKKLSILEVLQGLSELLRAEMCEITEINR